MNGKNNGITTVECLVALLIVVNLIFWVGIGSKMISMTIISEVLK
jgi:hypothetical protein